MWEEERDTLQESSILLSNNTVDVTNTWRALTAELMETAEVWAKLWEAALITYSERNNSRAAVCSYHFQRGNNPAAALHKQKPGRLFSEPRADSWV